MNAKAPDVGRLKVATVHLGYERPQVLGQKPASVSIEAQCESGPFDEQLLEAVEGDAQNGTRLSRTRRSGPFAAPEKGHFSEGLATANRHDRQFFSGRHHIYRSHLHDEHGVRLISLIEHELALPVLSRRRNLDEAGDVCICGILEQVNAVEKSLSIHGYPLLRYLSLPTAAEGAIELDDRVQFVPAGTGKQQLLVEELLVRDQHLEIIRQTRIVAPAGETGSVLQRSNSFLLLDASFPELVNRHERVRHIAKAVLRCLLVLS